MVENLIKDFQEATTLEKFNTIIGILAITGISVLSLLSHFRQFDLSNIGLFLFLFTFTLFLVLALILFSMLALYLIKDIVSPILYFLVFLVIVPMILGFILIILPIIFELFDFIKA